MTDRELLELAAKAAQIMVNPWHEKYGLLLSDFDFEPWNPLTDDGDALRLAVKLDLLVDCASACARPLPDSVEWQEASDPDDCATGCGVIVRAAAEIGKEMK